MSASATPERIQIKNRWTDAVMFECELSAECLGMSVQFKLGWVVKKAIEARAYLDGANLAGANLARANLARANLAGANLAGANLDGAYLADAKISDDITITRTPLQILGLSYPVLVFDQHIKIGCEQHSIAEWAAFDNERIARMDGVRARRFWHRHKAAILAFAASGERGVEAVEMEAV